MTEFKIPDVVSIMLLPDATYKAARPKVRDHHLTVAQYGAASQMSERGRWRLRGMVDSIVDQYDPIKAVANGIAILPAGVDGIAVVDLIDGVDVLDVRWYVTQFNGFDGAKIDTRHGFTPHISRGYYSIEDPDNTVVDADQIDNIEFTFDVVGLWFGAERYEVTL